MKYGIVFSTMGPQAYFEDWEAKIPRLFDHLKLAQFRLKFLRGGGSNPIVVPMEETFIGWRRSA